MTDAQDHLDGDERRRLDEQEAEQVEPVRPPDLNQESNRSATRLELFFDLAFVLFVARCADILAKDETWHGGLIFAAVLTAGWWGWASTTLYANRFDTDDAVFRLLTLVGMAGVVAMAAAADSVAKPEGRWFALAYVVLRLVLVAGYLRAWRHVPDARPTILPYLAGHTAGALLFAVSVVVPTPGRYWLWAAGIVVDLAGPAVAARLRDAVPLHMEHLPERFGLFVILVLGESVAATATGVHDGGWKTDVVVAAAFSFVVAAALWWVYFDLSGGAAKRRLLEEEGGGTRPGVHDFYVYAHLPVAVSLATVAVGLEHAVLHGTDDHLSAGTRGVLAAGLGGYLFSTALLQGGLSRQRRSALLWPGAGVPVVVLICLLDLGPVLTLGLLALVIAAGVVTGFALHRAGEVRTAKV